MNILENTAPDNNILSTVDIKELYTIVDKSKQLGNDEYIELFKIIKRNKEKYTENSNGIFINISVIKMETFIEFKKFFKFCEENRIKFLKNKNYEKNIDDFKSNLKPYNFNKNNTTGINDNINKAYIPNIKPSYNNYSNFADESDDDCINLNEENENTNIVLHVNKPKITGINAKILKNYKGTVKVNKPSCIQSIPKIDTINNAQDNTINPDQYISNDIQNINKECINLNFENENDNEINYKSNNDNSSIYSTDEDGD